MYPSLLVNSESNHLKMDGLEDEFPSFWGVFWPIFRGEDVKCKSYACSESAVFFFECSTLAKKRKGQK